MRVEEDPDVEWVAALGRASVDAAAAAVGEAQGERRLFSYLAREHTREGRSSYIEIDAPLELYALVRLLRPRHVVEVGVSSGVSSAYLLQALERNQWGTLHSIDLPKIDRRPTAEARSHPSWSLPAGRSPGWAVPFALRKRWDLRLGDKAAVLPLLGTELAQIDLLVYDVPHRDATTRLEFVHLDPIVPTGGVAIVDHGSDGTLCKALARWAKAWGTAPVRRTGTGLYGARRERTAARRGRGGAVTRRGRAPSARAR
jgi:hypothetical protein